MLIIIYHKTDLVDYLFEGINDKSDIEFLILNQHCTVIQRFFRKVLPGFIKHPNLYLGKLLRKRLNKMNENDSLLLIDYTNKKIVHSITTLIAPDVKKHLWIWNPLKSKNEEKLKDKISFIKNNHFDILTFNQTDANKYDLILRNQFYRMNQAPYKEPILQNDFYFLGYKKDRGNEIDEIKNQLSQYKILFKVVTNDDETIPYLENIEFIKNSKCIVDILQKEQSGLTLRPLEALAFNKKLITNNLNIRNEVFYSSKNIFIIGIDDFNNLDNFLKMGYQPISKDIIHKYDVNTWMNNF